ncbi:hypothetical protein KGA65_01865 [Ideonella sp. B7]|uniref:hypothetical protein n=1 Tax=Ideonella benzenivorans TaxID=2831643 RepID=UPI001CED475D|nr:hypothetical protein [Ideonella benzenivorans]MCA6215278.1 hypothetical protein [Ideonella benzenivorans]
MLIGEKFLFVELQKTGSTHIKQQLQALFGGVNEGKHNKPTPEMLASGRAVIGSIRDPWSWYLSLWSYGCQRRGSLYNRLVDPEAWKRSLLLIEQRQRLHGDLPVAQLTPVRAHDVWYADVGSAQGFREWLRAVCLPEMRLTVQMGFNKSRVGQFGCGLMTYRYLRLFTSGVDNLSDEVATVDDFRRWVDTHFEPTQMIRLHRVAEDLIALGETLGQPLSPAQCAALREAPPTNRSSRPHPFAHYYDQQCLDWVAEREWLLIERHGYERPVLAG